MACSILFASWLADYTPLCQGGQTACKDVEAQEDFARLLGVDVRTIRRIIRAFRQEGVYIPTRGYSKDMGREDLRALRRRRVARLFQEAKEQGAVLPHSDLAALFGVSTATIRRDVKGWEAEHGEKLPHRGQVHDIGPTTMRRAAIVESMLQGKQLPTVAREHNHGLEN